MRVPLRHLPQRHRHVFGFHRPAVGGDVRFGPGLDVERHTAIARRTQVTAHGLGHGCRHRPFTGADGDFRGHVVVQAVEIQGLRDDLHVLVRMVKGAEELRGADEVRILAREHGVRVQPVLRNVHQAGTDPVQGVDGVRDNRRVHVAHPDPARNPRRPQRLHREPVAQELVVHAGQRVESEGFARRVQAHGVAVGADRGRLVDGDPAGNAVAVRSGGDRGELPQPVGRVAVKPAAGVVQSQGRVPVIEGDHGRNPVGQELVQEPVVKGQSGRVHRAAAVGLDPRPGQREAIRVDAQLLHEGNIAGHAVIVVAGNSRAVAVHDGAFLC